jgi:hypothetical protein
MMFFRAASRFLVAQSTFRRLPLNPFPQLNRKLFGKNFRFSHTLFPCDLSAAVLIKLYPVGVYKTNCGLRHRIANYMKNSHSEIRNPQYKIGSGGWI